MGEAQALWASFDEQIDRNHKMWQSMDSAGEITLVPNRTTITNPGADTATSIQLRSIHFEGGIDESAESEPDDCDGSDSTSRPVRGRLPLHQKPVSGTSRLVVSALHCCPIGRKEWDVAPVC